MWLLSRRLWARRRDLRLEVQTHRRALLATLALVGLVYLVAAPASGLWRGFSAAERPPTAREWAGFFAGQVADALLFDVADGLGWGSTALVPASLGALLITATLHLLFGIGLCEVALSAWRAAMGRQQLYATVRECWVRMVARNDPSDELRLEGTVAPLELVDEVEVALLRSALGDVAEREGGSGFSTWEQA